MTNNASFTVGSLSQSFHSRKEGRGHLCFQRHDCSNLQVPFIIKSADELIIATQLTDYYRVLPVLSRALHYALAASGDFKAEIFDNLLALLEAAYKLRNQVLYKECMTMLMGPWAAPPLRDIETPRLQKCAEVAQLNFYKVLAQTQDKINCTFMRDLLPSAQENHRAGELSASQSSFTGTGNTNSWDPVRKFHAPIYLLPEPKRERFDANVSEELHEASAEEQPNSGSQKRGTWATQTSRDRKSVV